MPARSLIALVAALLISASALADEPFPNRPIQVFVPFSPGNLIDLLARSLADGMGAELGKPLQVVNKDGASGTLALAALAATRPDGYSLAFAPQGQLTIQPHLRADLPYKADGFDFVCQVFENPFAIMVGENSPLKSFGDLVTAARAKPNALSWGDVGIGTVPNLQMYELARALKVQMVHVPYRTAGQITQDTITGRLDMSAPSIGSFEGQPVRVLAILGTDRVPQYPDVPTIGELGLPLSMPGFGGFYAPKGLAPDILARLEAACATAIKNPSFLAFTARTGTPVRYLGSAAFAARIAEDSRAKAATIAALGIKLD